MVSPLNFREIEENVSHPLNQIVQHLTEMFSSVKDNHGQTSDSDASKSGIAVLTDESESIISEPGNLPDDICQEEVDLISCNLQTAQHYSFKKVSDTRIDHCLTVPSEYICPTLKETCDKGHTENNQTYHVRTSLLENFTFKYMSAENQPQIKSGPVFRPCLIQNGQLPIQYEMMLVWQTSSYSHGKEEGCSEKKSNMTETEDKAYKKDTTGMSEIENRYANLDFNSGDAKILRHAVYACHAENVFQDFIIEQIIENLQKTMGEQFVIKFHATDLMKVYSSHNCKTVHRPQVDLVLSSHYRTCSTFQKTPAGKNVLGYFVMGCMSEESRYYPIGQLIHLVMKNDLELESVNLALCLYIDDIAGMKFSLKDKRLLYSLEQRVTDQFFNLDYASGSGRVKEPSLYPMVFVHDMSFWESDMLDFDEIGFCNIIRNVALDVVVNVELIDRYVDPETEKHSRCYRMTFQSPDKTLCYDTSWKLQSLIRLEIEKHLKIILR